MALPNGAGGYQVGDGNVNEIRLGASAAPQTATSTATLTAAQITGNMLVANPSTSAATYTLPTAAAIDTALPPVLDVLIERLVEAVSTSTDVTRIDREP